MRASHILRQLCAAVVDIVHEARQAVVLAAVDALVLGQRLSLTALGRSLGSGALPKHRIKRVDRFLGNPHAQAEVTVWYGALARRLLGRNQRPVVLLDWTQTVGGFNALVAAVAFEGRALPIYAEVHPESRLGNRVVLRGFLTTLSRVLGEGVKPILVADAGFKTPFLRLDEQRGWDFVVRLRGQGVLKQWSESARVPDRRLSFRKVFAKATTAPVSIGRWFPHAHGEPLITTIVLGARPHPSRRSSKHHYRRRALEPWLLATSLDREPPQKVVALYALRMQIEETFRDTKNARLGWALEHARCRDAGRQSLLLLVASLALAAVMLTGAAVERAGYARRFQANSIRARRVQSVFRLGIYVLGIGEHVDVPLRSIVRERHRIMRFIGFRTWRFQLCLPFTRRRNGKWF